MGQFAISATPALECQYPATFAFTLVENLLNQKAHLPLLFLQKLDH